MKNTKPKYGIGDKVAIVNYGNAIWHNKKSGEPGFKNLPVIMEDEVCIWYDIRPDLVGKVSLVKDVEEIQGHYIYSIDGLGSWFYEKQIELIAINPNNKEH